MPRPLQWQRQVIAEAARFNVLAIGRRAGKSELGKLQCVTPEVLPYPVAWFSPTYKDMLEVWRDMALRLAPICTRQSAAERRLEYVTGGVLEFWSLADPQAGRGRKYRRVIIDEAAFVPWLAESWHAAIRPTLADMQGDAWILSTPKGRGGFWQLWQTAAANETGWRSWQMPSEVNPLIPPEEIQVMRRQLPERIAAQELDATFLDDAGGVFRRVMDAATATPQESGRGGREYVFGVDWGRSNDYTAIAVIDITTSECCHIDRFNQIDYSVQLGRLTALYERFRPRAIVAEANSMGQPLIEQLQAQGLPVVPFTTTAASKSLVVDALALAFERGALRIIPDATLIGELQAYEQERTATGHRYGAPPGMHDDTVMALMLAWYNPTPATVQVSSYARPNFSTPRQRPRQPAR